MARVKETIHNLPTRPARHASRLARDIIRPLARIRVFPYRLTTTVPFTVGMTFPDERYHYIQ